MSDPQKFDALAQTDLFHHGVITKLFPSNNTGFVRIESGREVPFSYEFVILCGTAKTVHDLSEGQAVGYDLGWTPSGLRVTKINSTAGAVPRADCAPSERQSS
jgi:hypothetical protein